MSRSESSPSIVVLSSLFPSEAQPGAGLFVRERMFRVGAHLPLTVVSPRPWFPFQSWLGRGKRPRTKPMELQRDNEVWFPSFFSIPLLLRRLDAWMMAIGSYRLLKRLRSQGRLDLLDAHFGYPDGAAAVRLGRWLDVPVCITLRGTEIRHAADPRLRPALKRALLGADQLFTVSDSLRRLALELGVPSEKVKVVGNGVDLQRFQRHDQVACRAKLGLSATASVLITVGGLVERKGFHRVIECLPELVKRHPELVYLVVGSASPEGDWTEKLKSLVQQLGMGEHVRFLGALDPDALAPVLSAADVFVLSSRNEGWANVLLEAMACGLPVVATDVGGNAEVVNDATLGTIVPFDIPAALSAALDDAINPDWDRSSIVAYAQNNTWGRRVEVLLAEFRRVHSEHNRARHAGPVAANKGSV